MSSREFTSTHRRIFFSRKACLFTYIENIHEKNSIELSNLLKLLDIGWQIKNQYP
ncbi:quinone oxidoreductase [Tolypothrix sp. PCC 7601]|nr:quinone oxidoreductase [Tolypothrix sp. PCC 7601]